MRQREELDDRFGEIDSEEGREAVVELARAAILLGPNSIAMIRDMVRRLVEGLPLGDWDRKLNWVGEALQETVDAGDYVTKEILDTRQRLAALERARTKILEADAALREVDGLAETERPPAEPLAAGG